MHKAKKLINRILGTKLRQRMFLVYILGGVLPICIIGVYLVCNTSYMLIRQVMHEEVTELEMVRRQVEETAEIISTVTKYFYFDEQLEEIAAKQYTDYSDIVSDYRAVTSFLDYGRYYNNIIAWINIFLENDTIVGNSRFVKTTAEMKQEEWYEAVKAKNGGALWRYRPVMSFNYDALTFLRMLKTTRGEDVGVLAVYVRPEWFSLLLQSRKSDIFILLNGETVVSQLQSQVEVDQIKEYLPEMGSGPVQKNITVDKMVYAMTCETLFLAESEDYLQIVSLKSYKDILGEVSSATAKIILFFGASIVLSVTVILLFSKSFSSRVECFLAQMKKAAAGNFELEENLGGNDEISILYDYLGTMISQIQKLLAEIYQEKLRAEKLIIRQKDAEFKMLASQINPHFLYNTLETIRMKARKSRQYDIEELVKMLAKILRSTLQAGNSEVTIRAEVELVEYYLKIQQYRFEERIRYRISLEEDLAECLILPLLLQPIVENSIIHGLEEKEGQGMIAIRIYSEAEMVVISVMDDGLGMDADRLTLMQRNLDRHNVSGKHIGVSNVHQRVKLKYGEPYGIRIDSEKGKFTKVEILLPAADKLGRMKHV